MGGLLSSRLDLLQHLNRNPPEDVQTLLDLKASGHRIINMVGSLAGDTRQEDRLDRMRMERRGSKWEKYCHEAFAMNSLPFFLKKKKELDDGWPESIFHETEVSDS